MTVAGGASDAAWLNSSGTLSLLGLGGYVTGTDGAFSLRYDRATGVTTFNGGSRDTPVERMRIDSTGNVGIGTSSPTGGGGGTTLNVFGGSAASFRLSSSTDALDLFLAGGSGFVQTATAIPMVFRTNATERMRITAGGNVGIGTTAPAVLLDINGSQVTRGDSSGYILFAPKEGTEPFGTNYDRFEIRVDDTSQVTTLGNIHGGTGSPRALAFLSGGSERMRIDTAGNVGIGTSSPATKLQIAVDSVATNPLGIVDTNASGKSWGIGPSVGTADPTIFALYDYTSSHPASYFKTGASGYWAHYTNGTERMRIDTAGNVGIGTASPGQALDVVGNIRASSTLLAGAIQTGYGVSTGDCAVEIGGDRTGSGNSYIDLHSTSGTDYETRIARYTGANGGLDILNTGTGNMVVGQVGAGPLLLYTSNLERMRIDSSGNVQVGTGAIATTATDGFLYIPTCAGTPTGTPTAKTGLAPMVVDSTNNKLYVYIGGAWQAMN